jgi:hypothetical protein
MRFGIGAAAAIVVGYAFVVIYGLDILDHFLRPLVYTYRAMSH